MFEFDFAHHIPSIVAGVIVGLLAFTPLLVALVPVLRRKREANMTVGFMGVFASFLVLFLGVIVTYLLARPVLVGFAAGEIIGFFLCWLAVAIALMLKKD